MTKLGYRFFTLVFCTFCVNNILLYPALNFYFYLNHSYKDSQGREEEAMNALNERQEKLRIELEKRRQAGTASTEASSATPTTSDSADPITETPAPSEAVPDNKETRKSKKSKKFKKPKAVEKN